jgi:hypothetical protein
VHHIEREDGRDHRHDDCGGRGCQHEQQGPDGRPVLLSRRGIYWDAMALEVPGAVLLTEIDTA